MFELRCSRKFVRQIQGPITGMVDLAFSPDGKILAVAGEDVAVRRWDVQTGEELGIREAHTGIVWAMSLSPDGHTLASVSSDGTARLWDLKSGKQLAIVPGTE